MITIKPELYADIRIKKQELLKKVNTTSGDTLLHVKSTLLFDGRQLTVTSTLYEKDLSSIPQLLAAHIKSSALLYKYSDIHSFANILSYKPSELHEVKPLFELAQRHYKNLYRFLGSHFGAVLSDGLKCYGTASHPRKVFEKHAAQ